jgi:hypothetical protein
LIGLLTWPVGQTDKAKIEELMGATQTYVALEDER